MSTMNRVLRGGATTSYPAEFQLIIEDYKFVKPATEDILDSCAEIIKEYTSGLNRYEKQADCFAAYAVRMSDVTARDSIASAKPGLEQIGRLYRQFAKDVQENVMNRVLRGGATTSYPAEFQLIIEDYKFAKPATEDILDSCADIIKEYTSGLNRYEKQADCFAAYAVKMSDVTARDSIASAKPGLEQIGRLYRQFAKDVQENVMVKLKAFLQTDYKKMTEEVSTLNRLHAAFDNAADNYRRKPTDAEAEQRKTAAEAAHEAQITVVKDVLSALTDYWDTMAECVTKFAELFFKLQDDEKEEIEKLIASNKC
uniref:BAR domain-containing protein n=1 Tax=Panagrolaimus sp. ES5 TaxID=591445 RepID=A0AC34FMR2_9BILA